MSEKEKQISIDGQTYQKLEAMAKERRITVAELAHMLLSKKMQVFRRVTGNTIRILEDPEMEIIKIQMPVDLPNRCKPEDADVERYVKVPLTDEDREILKDSSICQKMSKG